MLFNGVNQSFNFPIVTEWQDEENYFTKDGCYIRTENNEAECLLFPSKDNRDWSKWFMLVNDGHFVEMKDGKICKFDSQTQSREDVDRWVSKEEWEKFGDENKQIDQNLPKAGYVVLCRDKEDETWDLQVFAKYKKNLKYPFLCLRNFSYKKCVPLKGNEDIIGTEATPRVVYKWE